MDQILKALLESLEHIGRIHEELYDSEVRDQMSATIFDAFIRPVENFALPDNFGLHSPAANLAVRNALGTYIKSAKKFAEDGHLSTFHQRLSAFQNLNVCTTEERNYYDDFFGYSAPDNFNAEGRLLEPS